MLGLWIIGVLFYGIAFGVVSLLTVKRKNRDQFNWFLMGFFFGVFGLIAALLVEELESESDCAEEVKFEAKVCRFCGKRFDGSEIKKNQTNVSVNDPKVVEKVVSALSKSEDKQE